MSNVLFCYGKEHPETLYRQVCLCDVCACIMHGLFACARK